MPRLWVVIEKAAWCCDMITIVSGLPRSGTSMMMQMLEAGGMAVLADNIRKPDPDNPKGYYELEQVKNIKKDTSWLKDVENRAFKMVYFLLYDLPLDRHYKVIFMERDLSEAVTSQNRMLDRLGKKGSSLSHAKMVLLFDKHLERVRRWLAERSNFDVIYISYNDMMIESVPLVGKINSFLGNRLDTAKMSAVIDASLYRQRREG